MPLYLVRWPGLVAALIGATDEDELLDILDETTNPEGCTWSVYRGPVCIEFAVNAEVQTDEASGTPGRPLSPDQVRVGDVSAVCERRVMEAVIPAYSDTAALMVEAITRAAFPALHALVETPAETLAEADVRDALQRELNRSSSRPGNTSRQSADRIRIREWPR